MTRIGFGILGGVATALTGLVLAELLAVRPGDTDDRPAPRASIAAQVQPEGTAMATDQTQEWVEAVLGRPLFDPTRRPKADAVSSGTPRLSGVMISGAGKSAIFDGPSGGKPVVVSEGARLGVYILQSISAGQVTLSGPDGTRIVRPHFGPADLSGGQLSGQPAGLPGRPMGAFVATAISGTNAQARQPLGIAQIDNAGGPPAR